EADQAVINQGIDAKSYQQLLVMKVVGNRLQPFTNNLNHGSLKKRIIMMYQKPSNRWLMLKALCAIPVAALTINTFATPIETDPVEDMVKTLETTNVPTINEVKETLPTVEETIVSETPEQAVQDDNDDKNPLILVNGVEMEFPTDIRTLDNEAIAKVLGIQEDDIESITVLKDGAATAIYGDKGKNGVIEIKVKSSFMDKLPGVEKNDDGTYSINGRKVQKILVNGKEFFKVLSNDQKTSVNGDTEIPTIQGAIHDDPIFEVVEEVAQYPGGQAALMQYLAQNIRYPQIAAEHGVQARILVQFVIEKDGSLSNFKIIKEAKPVSDGITVNAQGTAAEGNNIPQEAYGALNIEALRVLRGMPNWIPAKQRGQVVRMKYTLPVTFRLQ
ncbi:MAG: energy transducer TonB, partial [Bacteroidaceae bacterium]|nr:energy transducer TonB [Bacteroidaceae bacterium]